MARFRINSCLVIFVIGMLLGLLVLYGIIGMVKDFWKGYTDRKMEQMDEAEVHHGGGLKCWNVRNVEQQFRSIFRQMGA